MFDQRDGAGIGGSAGGRFYRMRITVSGSSDWDATADDAPTLIVTIAPQTGDLPFATTPFSLLFDVLAPFDDPPAALWRQADEADRIIGGTDRPFGTPPGNAATVAYANSVTVSIASTISIFGIIPFADSAETDQNSEPSLAVNPLNPNQIIAASFGSINGVALQSLVDVEELGGVATPFFLSLDGGASWADYAALDTVDKSLAWFADGSGFYNATLALRGNSFTDIKSFVGTVSSGGFGTAVNLFAPKLLDQLDQPWVRTGPSNHVYVAYNNLNNTGGLTASVNVSTDGGTTFTPVVVEQVGAAAGQDAPSVRLAVNGSTVYAAFTRWNTQIENSANGFRFTSDIVVVRSDDGGADAFTALGTGGDGTVVANPVTTFAGDINTSLSLGQERDGSDLAIAVDPDDANHVIIAYQDAPGANGAGVVQLNLAESTDGGVNWSTKFTTSAATRSGQPALAILSNGSIGFLYNNYDPATNRLSQHFLETDDDFATTTDTVLASETNTTPSAIFSPYIGDFFDLTAVGNTFYGIFSASNADNGTDAQFLAGTTFQRSFTGTPGTADFQLTDGVGGNVAASIDPFFFVVEAPPCFVRGTMIATPHGEVAVEDLAIGDRVMTISGDAKPIRWIGRRAYDGRFAAANAGILPIRVAAGALADGVPSRDLLVSPEHALYLDGHFLPARTLTNGVTIRRVEAVDQVEYFHIELDAHDVIFAEGATAETFVDFGGRGVFHNSAEFAALYPDAAPAEWERYAALLAEGEAALPAIRAALLARADSLGQVTGDPELHLLADGKPVRAETIAGHTHRFTVPAGTRHVAIASRGVVPAESEAHSADRRRLGVPVERVTLRGDGLRVEIGPDCPALCDGFHADEGSHRWTDGRGILPPAVLACFAEDFSIEVQTGPTNLHYPIDMPAVSAANPRKQATKSRRRTAAP